MSLALLKLEAVTSSEQILVGRGEAKFSNSRVKNHLQSKCYCETEEILTQVQFLDDSIAKFKTQG